MMTTPFFSAWSARRNPLGSRTAPVVRQVRPATLSQIEQRFDPCVPAALFARTAEKANSRERIYLPRRTFWCWVWQNLTQHTSCRKVVQQVQALFCLHEGPSVSAATGAYCSARARLPTADLQQAVRATARSADQQAAPLTLLQGRPLKVADGSSVTLPDTPENQAAYPQPTSQKQGCGFPLMRLVVLFSLVSGAVLEMAKGNLQTAEQRLFHLLMETLERGDIVIGDQGFGHYVAVALLQALGVDLIARCGRRTDGRRGRRLGKNDWLLEWKKGCHRSALLTPERWALVPLQTTVRVVRGRLSQKGFRVQQITLVTTLLDPVLYPAREILEAYLRRWRLEMCLDDLKTTMGMEMLRCQSPELAEKEVLVYLISHNLIRWTMATAATRHAVPLERISFKGTCDALPTFREAIGQARSKQKRAALWEAFLATLAKDLVPVRPGRREPRAVKRKRNKYPRLNQPRHQFKDHPKRNDRRKAARLRKRGLN